MAERRVLEDGLTCSKCTVLLKIGENYTANRYDRYDYRCSPCLYGRLKVWRGKNKNIRRGQSRRNGRSLAGRYSRLKSAAKQRGEVTDITREEYEEIVSSPCRYCGFPLPEAGSGLDRVDSSVGYTKTNVVPCCHECNTAKSNHLSYSEMVDEIGPAIRRIKLKRGQTNAEG